MRLNYHLNILQVSILAALFSTADADMAETYNWIFMLRVLGLVFSIMSVIFCVAAKCCCGAQEDPETHPV